MQAPGAPASPAPSGSGNGEPIDEQEALARLRQTEDASLQYYAAWWLGRNRSRHPDAVPLLLTALRQRRPRDPGASVEENAVARNAARALGKLGDPAAIADLLATLEDEDDGLRQLWTWERGCDGYVYTLSTSFIDRSRSIILYRVPEDRLLDRAAYDALVKSQPH